MGADLLPFTEFRKPFLVAEVQDFIFSWIPAFAGMTAFSYCETASKGGGEFWVANSLGL
jgi:hypothetical protein